MTETKNHTSERDNMIREAEAANPYPQYQGHWDNWIVATIGRKGLTHRGMKFPAGTRVLMDPASIRPAGEDSRYPNTMFCTVYLPGWMNTSVRADRMEREG